MERLIVKPEADPQKAGSFVAWLESTGDFVVRSRQPLVDGAPRAAGVAASPLTMRQQGKGYDSFRPVPIRPVGVTYRGRNAGFRRT
jgi:hypothetical protein